MSNSIKVYLGVNTFYLLLLLLGQDSIAWYMKPLLIPILIYTTYQFQDFATKRLLLNALIFCWIGDVILMFVDSSELYFILGLVSFLIAHILFIILFIKQETEANYQKNGWFWFAVLLVLIYLGSMLSFLFPTLGDMKIPVTVYAATISIMLIMAIKGYFSWKKTMNSLILIGAIFFVTSDSFLAVNKFYNPIPSAHFLTMFTYIVAQYCITIGILELNEKK